MQSGKEPFNQPSSERADQSEWVSIGEIQTPPPPFSRWHRARATTPVRRRRDASEELHHPYARCVLNICIQLTACSTSNPLSIMNNKYKNCAYTQTFRFNPITSHHIRIFHFIYRLLRMNDFFEIFENGRKIPSRTTASDQHRRMTLMTPFPFVFTAWVKVISDTAFVSSACLFAMKHVARHVL